jgi:hypothetical protein
MPLIGRFPGAVAGLNAGLRTLARRFPHPHLRHRFTASRAIYWARAADLPRLESTAEIEVAGSSAGEGPTREDFS